MITLTIPQSAIWPLVVAAGDPTPKSRRGRLMTRIDSAPQRQFGRGKARVVDVPENLVNELRVWVDEAKQYASGNTQREGVRRLRQKIESLSST